ncbi:MAG: transglutaminase domain-containing protein [Firmicutes bacterium]|nr:transglutaminase domain-containing protein [Bacillota bacterium]
MARTRKLGAILAGCLLAVWGVGGGAASYAPLAVTRAAHRNGNAGPDLLRAWGILSSHPLPVPLAVGHPANQAFPVSDWWAGANAALTLEAYALTGSLGALQPGQPVMLEAIWTHPDKLAKLGATEPTWSVNSPDATIGSNLSGLSFGVPATAPAGTVDSGTVTFTASRPGIYAVRAEWDGVDSEPLVLTVGFSRLPRPPRFPRVDPSNAGVATVSAAELHRDPADTAALKALYISSHVRWPALWIGDPVDGWIPVSGEVPRTWLNPNWSHTLTVILEHTLHGESATVSYVLPVNAKGAFSGVIASPWAGNVSMFFQPSAYSTSLAGVLAAEKMSPTYVWSPVAVAQGVPLQGTLVATAALNYNDARFAGAIKTAAILWDNAPDPETGLMAISNWFATHIAYNYPEYEDKSWLVGATASETYAAHLGVCQDYAEVLAAVYRALGLSSNVIDGVVSDAWQPGWTSGIVRALSQEGLTHAWVEVYGVGGASFVTDPTWDGGSPPNLADARYLTNNYSGDTVIFRGTHDAETVEPNEMP